jgi:hypothetical protein
MNRQKQPFSIRRFLEEREALLIHFSTGQSMHREFTLPEDLRLAKTLSGVALAFSTIMAGDVGPYQADIHPDDAYARGASASLREFCRTHASWPSARAITAPIWISRISASCCLEVRPTPSNAREHRRAKDLERLAGPGFRDGWTVRVRARIRFPHDVGRRGHRSSGQHGNDNCGISGRPDLFHSQQSLCRIPPRIFGVDVVDILENHVPVAGTGASIGKQRFKFGGAERRGTPLTVVVEFVPDTVMREELERDALVALAADVFGELGFRPASLAELAAPLRDVGEAHPASVSWR